MPIRNGRIFRAISAALATCMTLWMSTAHAAAPIAVDDNFSVGAGQTASGILSTNDQNLDGPADAYSLAAPATNGSAVVNADGSFSYTPNAGFSGSDSFDYVINDGAGGSSTASVAINVASASDFIQVANPVLITPEDTAIPLGLSVAPDLFNGGALQDIVATEVLFRADNAGSAPSIATIPPGVTSISVTGYSTQSRNTAGNDDTDDDYQLLNARIDLGSGSSSGRLANLVDGNLNKLDQYSWENVPLGQFVLSDPASVVGYSTGASDPMFRVIGNQLQIIENHQLETAYHVEFLTANGNSTNFLGAGNSVQKAGVSTSTLNIPAALEPATGKKGIVILNSISAAAGSDYRVEHKGFSRLVIDLDSNTRSSTR